MSKSLGLALGCGGVRGMAHVGILVALEEAGITPDYITGCSIGAVVGACYASGMSAHEIRDITLNLKSRDIVDFGPAFLSRMALMRTKKVEELFLKYLGDILLEDMNIPFKCVATDLLSGKLHIFENGPAALAVQASCTIPGVFKPVALDGKLLVDGGCLCRVPTKLVKDMGAEVVVAVDILANINQPVDSIGSLMTLMLRVYDLMDAQQTEMRNRLEGNIADLLLEPEINNLSPYSIKDLDKTYETGYKLGKEYVPKIAALIE